MPRSYPDRPYVGVGVVVFRGDDVLLAQRGKSPRRNTWSIPGGAQELGETVLGGAQTVLGTDHRYPGVIDGFGLLYLHRGQV